MTAYLFGDIRELFLTDPSKDYLILDGNVPSFDLLFTLDWGSTSEWLYDDSNLFWSG